MIVNRCVDRRIPILRSRLAATWVRSAATVAVSAALLAGAAAQATASHGPLKNDLDSFPAWRTAAAGALSERGDANSLATAAALTFLGPPGRSKAEAAKAATAASELAAKASDQAPDRAALAWLHLQFCAAAPGCNLRDAATTMRWIDAENGAAWLPILARAQKDKDSVELDHILVDMAEASHFDLYGNRATVMMFDSLKSVRSKFPANYLGSDLARLTEAMGIAGAAVVPSFSPLINACRDATTAERRDSCLALSKTMQRSDAVMAQLVGFAIAKRLLPADSKELRATAERRRLLEWRVATANSSETPLLPWLKNAQARSRLAKMRAMPREEDVCTAILRERRLPLEPPEDRR